MIAREGPAVGPRREEDAARGHDDAGPRVRPELPAGQRLPAGRRVGAEQEDDQPGRAQQSAGQLRPGGRTPIEIGIERYGEQQARRQRRLDDHHRCEAQCDGLQHHSSDVGADAEEPGALLHELQAAAPGAARGPPPPGWRRGAATRKPRRSSRPPATRRRRRGSLVHLAAHVSGRAGRAHAAARPSVPARDSAPRPAGGRRAPNARHRRQTCSRSRAAAASPRR